MTRDELLELLTVERYGPTPARPRGTRPRRPVLVPIDSEGAIEARRGVLARIPITRHDCGQPVDDDADSVIEDLAPVEDTA